MHVAHTRYSTSKREDLEVGQGGRDGLILGLNGPGDRNRRTQFTRERMSGRVMRRAGTERVNKEGKKFKKKTELESAMEGCC